MIIYYEIKLITLLQHTVHSPKITSQHHCPPAGYTTTLILKIIALHIFYEHLL